MKFTEIKDLKEVGIKVVSFMDKCSMMETIVDFSIDNDTKNELYFELMSNVLIAKAYLDIEWDIDLDTVQGATQAYEILVSLGFIELLYRDDRLKDADLFSNMALRQVDNEITRRNSIALVLKDGIEKLIEKIPNIDSKQIDKWMKALPKQMDKLSPENKELLLKVVGK